MLCIVHAMLKEPTGEYPVDIRMTVTRMIVSSVYLLSIWSVMMLLAVCLVAADIIELP